MSDHDISNTILYLRPRTTQAAVALALGPNQHLVETIAPPRNLGGLRSDQLRDLQEDASGSYGRSSDIVYVNTRVLRLGFNSPQKNARKGFLVGTESDSDIVIPYLHDQGYRSAVGLSYFRIRYNFKSGALMIMAMQSIHIGVSFLFRGQALVLTTGMIITCGGDDYQYTLEFPDLTQCTTQHENNYRRYVEKLGLTDALYMATSHKEDPHIGLNHRVKARLGKGGCGIVYKAVNVHTGALVAIKKIGKDPEDKPVTDQLNEVKILSNLHHVSPHTTMEVPRLLNTKPSIIQYYEAFEDGDEICIVMELAVNDLTKHLNSRRQDGRRLSLLLQIVQSVGHQALSAIKYLHEAGITHRDLKDENILVTNWSQSTDLPTIKIADFGLATLKTKLTSICGTPSWYAPELLKAMNSDSPLEYNNSVDIWTMGKILMNLLDHVRSSLFVDGTWVHVPKERALRLVIKMMEENPRDRPSAAACLRDPWMNSPDNYSAPLVLKRARLPFPTASDAQPFRRPYIPHNLVAHHALVANNEGNKDDNPSSRSDIVMKDASN